ncbi:MAG: hypothetical protein ACYDBQ_01545 [Thermoplasmatota archaeon]
MRGREVPPVRAALEEAVLPSAFAGQSFEALMHPGRVRYDMDPESPLTPAQALAALEQMERHEERLGVRAGCLTGIVWGLVSPAIFLTYGLANATPGFPDALFPFLWLPWTAAAMGATYATWRLPALTVRRPAAGKFWYRAAGGISLFSVMLLAMNLWHPPFGPFVFMVMVNGLTAALIAWGVGRRGGFRAALPLLMAALFIVVGGIAIGLWVPRGSVAAFASAATVGIGFLGASFVGFVRG